MTKHDWDTVFLSNHDNPRIVSTFGDDSPTMRVPSAKLFETMILTLRGTPFLFQGDELGMTDFPFKTLADYDDIAVKNAYKALVDTGKVSAQEFLASEAKVARDNARTPMQWDSSPEAGFTTSTHHGWLSIPTTSRSTLPRKSPTLPPSSTTSAHSSLCALTPQPSSMATSKTLTHSIPTSSPTPAP